MSTNEALRIINTPQRCSECGTFKTRYKQQIFWTCLTCHTVFTPELAPDELDLLDAYKPPNTRPLRGGLG